jgi:hypothetical protein
MVLVMYGVTHGVAHGVVLRMVYHERYAVRPLSGGWPESWGWPDPGYPQKGGPEKRPKRG